MTDLLSLYPPIEPYETGMLDVGDGHRIYWERVGKPGGKPAVFLHGGPGGGMSADHRRLFDPTRYDVLLFDQRGCGRSTPHAGLEANTTWHLVADIERLRECMRRRAAGWCSAAPGARRWRSPMPRPIPSGSPSWSCAASSRCAAAELDWYYQGGASLLFPDKWERFLAPIPEAERGDLIGAYRRRLTGDDRGAPARGRQGLERCGKARPSRCCPIPRSRQAYSDDDFALAFARIENHYFVTWRLAGGGPAAPRRRAGCAASPA